MNFAFREVYFLSKYSTKTSIGWLVPMYSSFVHILILTLITICNNNSSSSTSRGSLINVKVFSATFGFDPRPVPSRIKFTLSSNLLHHLKHKFVTNRSLPFVSLLSSCMFLHEVFLNNDRIRQLHVFQLDPFSS